MGRTAVWHRCRSVQVRRLDPSDLDPTVCGRIPLHGPVNSDNRRYLTAKATRAGHKLDHLLAALDASEAPLGGDKR